MASAAAWKGSALLCLCPFSSEGNFATVLDFMIVAAVGVEYVFSSGLCSIVVRFAFKAVAIDGMFGAAAALGLNAAATRI